MLLTVVSPAPLVFLFVFLVLSPTSRLLTADDDVQASGVVVRGDAPVVMIVFDELSGLALMGRDGRINASRYPSFARLARGSTWYRNATTVADYTNSAVPALLTGERPDPGDAPIAADHPESLFTLLGDKYTFDVTEPITDVCPRRLCPAEQAARPALIPRLRSLASDLSVVSLHLLLPDDLARGLPPVARSFENFRGAGSGQGAAAIARVLQIRADRLKHFDGFTRRLARSPARAHLSFLHLQLPHDPYQFLPSGQRYANASGTPPGQSKPGKPFGTWGDDRLLVRQGFQRYLLQLAYTDRLLGLAMARLRATGRYERSLVVVMADHGVSFVPNQSNRRAGAGNLPQIAGIPLFIKTPGQSRGRIDDANVQSTDVLPTVAAALGIRLPWDMDGRPAGTRTATGEVFVQPEFDAKSVTSPFSAFVRRRDAAVKEMVADLGEGPGELYRAGPDKDLVGRKVDALATTSSTARFELDGSGLLGSVEPRGPDVPSFVMGTATGVGSGSRLAISVNGHVDAVTVPYRAGDETRFGALVPPRAFVRGENAVGVVMVTGTGRERRFRSIRDSTLAYRLVRDGDRETLIEASGRRIAVVPGAIEGYVDERTVDGADVTVTGWAGTTGPARAAERVVAFAGDRFLAADAPSAPRSDLERTFGSGLARAGFRLRGQAGGTRVRIYAILGDRASALSLRGGG